jgi:hypothetical protein
MTADQRASTNAQAEAAAKAEQETKTWTFKKALAMRMAGNPRLNPRAVPEEFQEDFLEGYAFLHPKDTTPPSSWKIRSVKKRLFGRPGNTLFDFGFQTALDLYAIHLNSRINTFGLGHDALLSTDAYVIEKLANAEADIMLLNANIIKGSNIVELKGMAAGLQWVAGHHDLPNRYIAPPQI